NQLKVPTDTIHDDISNIEHIISEQSKIKVLYNRLNSDIHTKKSYLNKLYNDLSLILVTPIDEIEHLIGINTEVRNNIEYDINQGNIINTEWEKYTDYLSKNEEYINIETKLETSKIKLLESENNIKNGYTLRQIITKSETCC